MKNANIQKRNEEDKERMIKSPSLVNLKKQKYIKIFLALIFSTVTTLALGVNYSIASWDKAVQLIASPNSIMVSLAKLRQNFNFYSLHWQICSILLFIFYYKLKFLWSITTIEIVAALLFGIINVFSNSLVVNGNSGFVFANTYQMIISSVCIVGQAVLLFGIMKVFFWVLDEIPKIEKTKTKIKKTIKLFDKYTWRFSFCFLIFCWLPDLIVAYPAQLTNDGASQLAQWMKIMPRTDTHPFFATVLFGFFFEIGKLFKNDNFTIFFIVLSQSFIIASCFATVVKKIHKMHISNSMSIIALSFYGLHPIWGEYAHTLVKDSVAIAVFTLFMLEVATFILSEANYLNEKNCFKLIFTGIVASMLRHNYKYVIIPTLFLLFGIAIWHNHKKLKCAIICVMMFFGSLQAGTFFAENILDFSAGSIPNALAIPFQQTARYVKKHTDEVTEREKNIIEAVFDYDKLVNLYNPNSAEAIMLDNYHGDNNNLKEYFVVWFEMFFKHPDTYIEATIYNSHTYYAFTSYAKQRTIGDILRSDSTWRPNAERLQMNISHPTQLEPLLITWENTKNLLMESPFLGLLCNCAFYTWLLLLLGIYFVKRKKYRLLLILVPQFLVILTCIASPINGEWRYYAPVVASIPIVIAVCIQLLKSSIIEEVNY